MKLTLDQLAIKYSSDKSSKHHNYCVIYEKYLESLRDEQISFLELGYGGYENPNAGGESARMWRAYFSKAHITVTDINNKINTPLYVNFLKTDQRIIKDTKKFSPYDVIVDDASHINRLTIEAFKSHWPLLKSGGLYIIEDLHSSYIYPYYLDANPDPTKGKTAMNFFKRLTDDLNKDFIKSRYYLGYGIEYMHFYREFLIIKKK